MRISPGLFCVVVLAAAVLAAAVVTATATSIAGREAVPVVIADQPRFQIVEISSWSTNFAIEGTDVRGTFLLDRQTGRVWSWKLTVGGEGRPSQCGWFLVYVEGVESARGPNAMAGLTAAGTQMQP